MKAISEATKRLARKTGKLPKAPKKPKRNASLSALEGYKARHAMWVQKINQMAKDAGKKETLKKSIFGS